MNWIFCISFALLTSTSTTQSLRKPRRKLGPDLASSAELAHIGSNLNTVRNTAIDMDYFGGSSEKALTQMTSEEISAGRSDLDLPRINSVDRSNPIFVYIVDPKAVEEPQEKLMKVRSVQGLSSESKDGVTYEDLLKFLIQVGARLKEQQGTNSLSDHPNPMDLIRNTRRRIDDSIYETDKVEPTLSKHEISEEPVMKVPSRAPIRKKELSVEKYNPKDSGRNKFISREEPPRMKKRKISMEESPRSNFKKRGSKARIPRYSYEPLSLKDLFRTPKPFIGKVGIYEEK